MRISLKTLLPLLTPFVLLVAAAYFQWATVGLPSVSPDSYRNSESAEAPHGFPPWLCVSHYLNFLFLVLLVRSGLRILMDHPRLYWNVHCIPGTEWLCLTPVEVPRDRVWTAKQDSRYLSPWIGLPRHWHFLSVLFWVGNGLVFVVLMFATGQWRHLVPISWQIVPDAWAIWVHYATFHLPPEPNGLYQNNALPQRNRQIGRSAASTPSAKGKGATTRTTNTSVNWPTFEEFPHMPTPLSRVALVTGSGTVLSLIGNDLITGDCLAVDGGRTVYAAGN